MQSSARERRARMFRTRSACAQSARGVEKYTSRVRAENNSQMMAGDKASEPRRGSHFAVCRSRNGAQPGWHNSPTFSRYTLLTKWTVYIELPVPILATNNSMFCQAINHAGEQSFDVSRNIHSEDAETLHFRTRRGAPRPVSSSIHDHRRKANVMSHRRYPSNALTSSSIQLQLC